MPSLPGVPESPEWRLLNGLGKQRHFITRSHFAHVKRPQQLKNNSRKIDFELRRLLFELLRILEDLEFQDDLNSDDSVKRAVGQLPTLCTLLDGQVNKDVVAPPYPSGSTYPKLTALVKHLSLHPDSNARYGLVSYTKGTYNDGVSALFLTTRNKPAQDTAKCLADLNGLVAGLVAGLKRSPGTIAALDASKPYGTFAYGQFLRKVIAAFRAVFSGFSKCHHTQHQAHELLFHLPTLGTIEPTPSNIAQLGLGMFLTCPSIGWQEASVELVSVMDDKLYRTPPLCGAIDQAVKMGTGLVFHVEYNDNAYSYAKCTARVPKAKRTMKTAFKSCPGPDDTLRKLLESGIFRRLEYIELGSPDFVSWAERRSLATKLIVGMLISLEGHHVERQLELLKDGDRLKKQHPEKERHHVIECWDSEKVYLIEVPNEERHVSCNVTEKTGTNESILLLPTIPEPSEGLLGPSPALTILAKTLLEICFGPLDYVQVDPKSDCLSGWKVLDGIVDEARKRAQDLHVLPFFEAARACLDFHVEYENDLTLAQQRLKHEQPNNSHIDHVAVAKTTFTRCVMQTFMKPEISPPDPLLNDFQKPVISLFDDSEDWGKGSREANWAEEFLGDFKVFRDSYELYATIPSEPHSHVRSRRPVRIAIIDTGVDKRHGGLRTTSFPNDRCRSWVRGSDDVNDLDGHGTYCAHFVHKIAPRAEVYIAQTFSGKTFNLEEAKHIAEAIRHAVSVWQVDIISMSFGLQYPSSEEDRTEWEVVVASIRDAVEFAASKHVLMFAAASNNGKNRTRTFPSTMTQVVCIHASDGNANDGGINPEAEEGVLNFTTLGIAIPSPRFHARDLAYKSGTSFATPVAAGTAAVMLDFARRTTYLRTNTKNGLRTVEGIRKMFLLMSKPDGTSGKYRYVAPWLLWTENCQVNSGRRSEIISRIDNTFTRLALDVKFPDDAT